MAKPSRGQTLAARRLANKVGFDRLAVNKNLGGVGNRGESDNATKTAIGRFASGGCARRFRPPTWTSPARPVRLPPSDRAGKACSDSVQSVDTRTRTRGQGPHPRQLPCRPRSNPPVLRPCPLRPPARNHSHFGLRRLAWEGLPESAWCR